MTKHKTLRGAMENLFVDNKTVTVDFPRYYDACSISSCTYTYMSSMSSVALISVMFGLVGGITSFLNLIFKTIYATGKFSITSKKSGKSDAEQNVAPTDDGDKGASV